MTGLEIKNKQFVPSSQHQWFVTVQYKCVGCCPTGGNLREDVRKGQSSACSKTVSGLTLKLHIQCPESAQTSPQTLISVGVSTVVV